MIRAIHLDQIYPITHPEHYKLHLACGYKETKPVDHFVEPLDDFVADPEEWDSWNWPPRTLDDFSREFIFALMDFHPEKDRWLFGGAYHVLGRTRKRKKIGYRIELLEESKPFIGRLKLELKRPARTKALYFEKYYKKLLVSEILPEPYSGERFCGHDRIDLDFRRLEQIVRRQRDDWKTALEHAKGVYLISDTSNGKRYIGAAYGAAGLWSRWGDYIETGYGDSEELRRLIRRRGIKGSSDEFVPGLMQA
jgi:hypothetical protein